MADNRIEALVEKFLDGDLNTEESAELEALCTSDAGLRQRIEDDVMVRSLLRDAAVRNFAPSFADDIVDSIASEAALTALLSAHKTPGLDAGFERRVMATVKAEARQQGQFFNAELGEALTRFFPRIAAPVALAVSIAVVMNVSAAETGAPLIDVLLGLPSAETMEISLMFFN